MANRMIPCSKWNFTITRGIKITIFSSISYQLLSLALLVTVKSTWIHFMLFNFFRSNLYYPNKLYLSSLSFAKDYLNTSCPRTTPISSPQGNWPMDAGENKKPCRHEQNLPFLHSTLIINFTKIHYYPIKWGSFGNYTCIQTNQVPNLRSTDETDKLEVKSYFICNKYVEWFEFTN